MFFHYEEVYYMNFLRTMKSFLMLLTLASAASSCTFSGGPEITMQANLKVNFSNMQKWKKGEDCYNVVLGFGPFGTNSLVNAAKNGRIKRVHYYEERTKFYVVAWKKCVIAYGT